MADVYDQLLRSVAAKGIHITSLADLESPDLRFPGCGDLLLDWLDRLSGDTGLEDPDQLRIAVVRALTRSDVDRAKAMPVLIDLFTTVEDDSGYGIRWVVGTALAALGREEDFEAMEDLIQTKAYGKARQMAVLYFSHSHNARTVPLLISLLKDQDTAAFAATALGTIGEPVAIDPLARAAKDKNPLIRREAKRALQSLLDQQSDESG